MIFCKPERRVVCRKTRRVRMVVVEVLWRGIGEVKTGEEMIGQLNTA